MEIKMKYILIWLLLVLSFKECCSDLESSEEKCNPFQLETENSSEFIICIKNARTDSIHSVSVKTLR